MLIWPLFRWYSTGKSRMFALFLSGGTFEASQVYWSHVWLYLLLLLALNTYEPGPVHWNKRGLMSTPRSVKMMKNLPPTLPMKTLRCCNNHQGVENQGKRNGVWITSDRVYPPLWNMLIIHHPYLVHYQHTQQIKPSSTHGAVSDLRISRGSQLLAHARVYDLQRLSHDSSGSWCRRWSLLFWKRIPHS